VAWRAASFSNVARYAVLWGSLLRGVVCTQVLSALANHIGLVWEWSRSTDLRLRVSACGLVRGLVLESPESTVRALQRSSLEWGVRDLAGVREELRCPLQQCGCAHA
jgi:hypothetical protein